MGKLMISPPLKKLGGERWGSRVTTCHPTTTPYRGVGGGGEGFPVVVIKVGKFQRLIRPGGRGKSSEPTQAETGANPKNTRSQIDCYDLVNMVRRQGERGRQKPWKAEPSGPAPPPKNHKS